jgi:hypothetical protein
MLPTYTEASRNNTLPVLLPRNKIYIKIKMNVRRNYNYAIPVQRTKTYLTTGLRISSICCFFQPNLSWAKSLKENYFIQNRNLFPIKNVITSVLALWPLG